MTLHADQNSPLLKASVESATKTWRNRVICQTENRRRNFQSIDAPDSPNSPFRGSLNPKEWRTSYDTEEIAAVIKPFEYPSGKIKHFKPKDRFTTHNNREYLNRSINRVPTFGSADVRKLRRTIDTGSPVFIDKDPEYVDIY
jgi:hypothetical protein